MESTVQLNARLNRSLKQSGDEALALIGLSPTQAVRALWEKASRRGKDLEEVRDLLCGNHASAEKQRGPAPQVDETLAAGWAIIDDAYRRLGIDPSVKNDLPSDTELLEEALYERLVERGLA